jgi:hypothetical protein
MISTYPRGALAAVLLTLACPALAHTTLDVQQAPIKSTYKALLRVGHGCDGAQTLKLRVRIPDGVIAWRRLPWCRGRRAVRTRIAIASGRAEPINPGEVTLILSNPDAAIGPPRAPGSEGGPGTADRRASPAAAGFLAGQG